MSYGDPINYGWVQNPVAVEDTIATMPFPVFSEAGAHLLDREYDQDALLYEACKTVTGNNLNAHKQTIGCCVSEGYSSGIDYLECVQIALKHTSESYQAVSHAAIYGMARELGGMLGGGDGLVGAYAAKCVSTLGAVRNDDVKDSDTDDTLAKKWGRVGCPSDVKELALKHKAQTASLVQSAEECRAAICNGYPVPVCSGQGFTMQRDSEGTCHASGSWSHCMLIMAYWAAKRRFCILQSWGANTPSGPTVKGQPDCSFWADWDTADRMLKQRDSFALSAFEGFPAQTLNWRLW